MQNGVVDSENKTVQDAIALLFKKETGLQYTNEEPDMTNLNEDFNIPITEDYNITDGANGQKEIIALMDEL